MPEVNFAREREERAGAWPESQFVVRSRIPAGREPSRANGLCVLACGQTRRRNFGMCIYMEKHALYYARDCPCAAVRLIDDLNTGT